MYTYKVTLDRVVDGDTADVNIDLGFDCWLHKQRVRFDGIDTPEIRTRDDLEKAAGILAANRVTELLENAAEIQLTCTSYNKSTFNRIVGKLWVDGKSVNNILLAEKLAVEWAAPFNKEDIADAHAANWQYLRENKLI